MGGWVGGWWGADQHVNMRTSYDDSLGSCDTNLWSSHHTAYEVLKENPPTLSRLLEGGVPGEQYLLVVGHPLSSTDISVIFSRGLNTYVAGGSSEELGGTLPISRYTAYLNA